MSQNDEQIFFENKRICSAKSNAPVHNLRREKQLQILGVEDGLDPSSTVGVDCGKLSSYFTRVYEQFWSERVKM